MANTAPASEASPTASSTAGGHETLTSTTTPSDTRGKAKRQTIPVACTACQRRKSKCDGKRPACSVCRKKTTTCTYDVEAGETRVHALRKKNDALAFDMATMSSVLTLMREKPFAEAEEIFRRVRSAQDIASLLANFDERPPKMPKNDSSEGMGSMLSHSTSSRTDPSASPSLEHQLSATSRKRSTPGIDPPSSTLSLIATQPLPDEDKLRQAVDAFFAGAGKLFHVFSRQQGMLLFDNVYRPADNRRDNAAICELTALGALGWCYGHEGLAPGDGDVYYSFARYHLEDSIDADTLRGMRSCALIAMYNIMDKSTVALAYIELGLSMARQRGLHGKVRPLEMAKEEWIDCKRVWRTLTFLASWLSASVGLVSDADKPVNDALEELAVEDHSDFDDLIQTKIAEISVITASMLRTVYGFDRLSPRAARMMIDDLERWYQKLPPSMELGRLLYSPNIGGTHTTRGPALFVHLLYFGALLMLFRRIVAQAHYTSHLSSGQSWLENKPDTSICLEKGIHAAVQSARILDALNTRYGIFKHCWLVICQSYCSCAILLYAAVQRKARYYYDSSAADYILEAEKCLAVLHYCGQADFVARNYHTTLRAHYDKLAVLMLVSLTDRRAQQAAGSNSTSTPQPTRLYEQITYIQKEQQRSTESRQTQMTVSPLQLADIMLDVPQGGARGLHTIAHALQELLRRPYGGEVVDSMRGSTSRPPRTQPNDLFSSIPMLPSIIEKPDWRFEVCSPFNWTSPHLVPLDERETVATETIERLNRNYFVASDGLAGWTGSADKRRRVDVDALD